jgi:capsid portal protein
MKLATAKLLEHLGTNEAGLDVEVKEDHSGRGMYSKTTIAIVTKDGNEIFGILASLVGFNLDEWIDEWNDEEDEEGNQINESIDIDDIRDSIANLKMDQFGKYGYIYY